MISGATATVVRELAESGVLLHASGGGLLYAAGPRLATCPGCNEVRAFFVVYQLVDQPAGGPVSLAWLVACLACVRFGSPVEHGDDGHNSDHQSA